MDLIDYVKIGRIIREELGSPSTLMLNIIWTVMSNEGITQAELEKQVGASRSGICMTLGKLDDGATNAKTRGIIRTEPDAMDTRALGVYLTPKGKALKKRFTLLK